MNELVRLQVYMASCGVASRRKCEEIILSGKVCVNGIIIKELGTKIGKNDIVTVNGNVIKKEEHVYYVLNKPSGYVTTLNDEHNRKTVMDLFLSEDLENRIFPIGRLDYETQGVLLFTNDGSLSNRLTSSSANVEKEYLARVRGRFTKEALLKLMRGVKIEDYKTKPAIVEIVEYDKINDSSLVKITITEGKNRQVRKMFDVVGFEVKKLTRLRFGTISLDGLPRGSYRKLKIHEIKQLHNL